MADETQSAPPDYNQYTKETEYAGGMVRASGMHLGDLRHPKVRTIINAQIDELRKQLTEREDLLKQLDAQPATEKLLDTMRRLGI